MLYTFQSFELDTDQLEFRAADKVCPLEPQVFDVLRHLVANSDRVISRDELIEVIWSGRAISDATVSSRINAARTALGDNGKRQALIRTVPRRGFRFLGNVTITARTKVTDAVAAGAHDTEVLQPNKPGIAVLPFNNMSGDREQEYFADGLVEDIITALSKVSRLRVIARNSSFIYKGRSDDVRKVADDLDVRYVLEGSVRSDGERIRVTAQLIDAEDSSHLWAERYDRNIDHVFDIQDEIAKEIVTHLRVQLADGEHALMLSRGTNSVAAWQYCVRALDYWLRLNASDHVTARKLAEKAVEIDPNYAAAWALIGWSHHFDGRLGLGGDRETTFAKAADLAAKALALDENNPYAIGLSNSTAASSGHHDRGVEITRSGLNRLPGNADVRCYLSYALMHVGRYEEAIENFQAAITLNPHAPNWYLGGYSRALLCLGRFAESLEITDRILAEEPGFFQAWIHRIYIYQKTGKDLETQASMIEAMRLAPQFRLCHIPGFFLHRDPAFLQTMTETLRSAGLPE